MTPFGNHRKSRPLPPPRPYLGPRATAVCVRRGRMIVELKDGRTLAVPLALIPGFDALPRGALTRYKLIGDGIGIHFPAIDDDVSVENLLHPERTMRPAILPRVVTSPRSRVRKSRVGVAD